MKGPLGKAPSQFFNHNKMPVVVRWERGTGRRRPPPLCRRRPPAHPPTHSPTHQVIKVGTSSLIRAEQNSLNLSSLAGIVEAVRDLQGSGHNVVLVSSGAVGVGCQRLGLTTRPDSLAQKQALAAVGQVHLMRYYDDLFSALGVVSELAGRSAARRVLPLAL